MDVEMAVARYMLLRTVHTDIIKGGCVAIIVKDTILAIPHPLLDFPVN